jgi:hypothetical protein
MKCRCSILREVSWNPLMAESLSYIYSKSLGFVYGATNKEAYPDENYSRFVIGIGNAALLTRVLTLASRELMQVRVRQS